MKKFGIIVLSIVVSSVLLCGCGKDKKDEMISGEKAKVEVINNGAWLVDVRDKEEYDTQHISGAISLPLNEIDKADDIIPSKDKILIVYCNSGTRSSSAKQKLIDMGYKNVYNLGAMANWYE